MVGNMRFLLARAHVSCLKTLGYLAICLFCGLIIVVGTVRAQSSWTNRLPAAIRCQNVPNAIAIGSNGNVYVAGYAWVSPGSSNSDYMTLAYSRQGLPLWTNRYNGPANNFDRANGIALGPEGNVYVTGYSSNHNSGYDYATVAYSMSGLPLWTNRYDGYASTNDQATCIGVGKEGNVYVSGFSSNGNAPSTNFDYFDYVTIAYSAAGGGLWTNRFTGTASSYDQAFALAVGTNGNVYVTGWSGFDFATVAYSNSGLALWTNRYDGPGRDYDAATAIGIGPEGNVYVTGAVTVGVKNEDYTTLAYSSDGMPLWTNRYNGPGSELDQVKSLAVGPSGNVYITGQCKGVGFINYDFATIAYSRDGVGLWTNRYGADAEEGGVAVVVDANENVYVTGFEPAANQYARFVTLKYASNGMAIWTNRFDSTSTCVFHDIPTALAVDELGHVYVTGYSEECLSNQGMTTIRYAQSLSPTLLNYQVLGHQLRLNWTNSGFTLQSAGSIHGIFTNIHGATTPYTADMDDAKKFFRLVAE
jgi:hypothetical protein